MSNENFCRYEVYRDGARGDAQKYLLPAKPFEMLRPFYLGCSFGFELALQRNGVALRNVEQKKNVSMFLTNIQMNSVGFKSIHPFHY